MEEVFIAIMEQIAQEMPELSLIDEDYGCLLYTSILGKLSAAIRNMEQEVGIADSIRVLTGLIDWVRAADLEKDVYKRQVISFLIMFLDGSLCVIELPGFCHASVSYTHLSLYG